MRRSSAAMLHTALCVRPRLRVRRITFLAVIGWVMLWSAVAYGQGELNLLAQAKRVDDRGTVNLDALADGVAVPEGSFWMTSRSARLRSRSSFVLWDLGREEQIRCVFVQGDNNDAYTLQGSLDGRGFFPLWTGRPVGGGGMRLRVGKVTKAARYIQLSAAQGDGSYAVSEVGAYASCPAVWPPALERVEARSLVLVARWAIVAWALATMLFVLVHRRERRLLNALLALVPAGLAVVGAWSLYVAYPFFEEEKVLRAAIAAIAGTCVLRELLLPRLERWRRHPASPRVMQWLLVALALLAVGCYYHFGAAQFWHSKDGRRTYVHTFDMRHYFPVAKYFDELRFDGLYAASLAAYMDLSGKTMAEVGDVKFRDLRTSEAKLAREMEDHVREVRARFSEARWQEFVRDMGTFLDIMGPGAYLGSMRDHGGNATPVWILGAHLILKQVPATETTLVLVGLLDPLLLGLLALAIWRAFGGRTLLYVAILFGATDFYQFGSNLMGSMLRQDWLVALGLGACALKTRRYMLGGALLAYGGLIRAFPAVATMFLAVPILWWLVDYVRAHRALPAPAALAREQAPALRAIAGAFVCVVLLFALSSAVFGVVEAWGNWFAKISIHAMDPSINNVGLRNVMAFAPANAAKHVLRPEHPEPWIEWQRLFFETLEARWPLSEILMLLFLAAAVLAARRRPLHQVPMLGLTTIPWIFYLSNYYCHYFFLLPLAFAADPNEERGLGRVLLLLFAMCAGQYYSYPWANGWGDLQYTYQSFMLLFVLLAMVLPDAVKAWRDWRSGLPAC